MSNTLVPSGSGSSTDGTGTPTTLPPPASLIVPAALSELRNLLLRDEVRHTLIGISAIRTLLLAELLEQVKGACKDHKKLVDYITPGGDAASPSPGAAQPAGGLVTQPSAHAATAQPAASRFVVDLADKMASVVKMPIDQLRITVDAQGKTIGTQGETIETQGKTIDTQGKTIDAHAKTIEVQGKAIDKGATDITGLQTGKTASDARIQALEVNHQRLAAAHRGLSDRVVEMGFELNETEEVTEALSEAVLEAGPPVILVVEEGENSDPADPPRKTQARPMRQAGAPVRKAPASRKK
jgi:hypothetical protein